METLLYQSLLVLSKQAASELYRVMKVTFTTHNSHISPEKQLLTLLFLTKHQLVEFLL